MTLLTRLFQAAILSSVAVLVLGCAAPTALTSKTKELDLSEKSIVLVTVELTRESNRTMPWPTRLQVMSTGATGAREVQAYAVDSEGMEYGEDNRHYVALVRLSLPPGKFHLAGLMGEVSAFPFKGIFQAPLGLAFDVPPGSVVYLGRVKLHMRSRKDTEFRAGALFPLVSQAALGVSTSTFDISTADASATDMPLFKETFSVLRNIDVKVQGLPSFNREPIDRAFVGSETPAPAEKDSTATPQAQ
jgi:hypothetical protein